MTTIKEIKARLAARVERMHRVLSRIRTCCFDAVDRMNMRAHMLALAADIDAALDEEE